MVVDKNLTITGPTTSGTPTAVIDAQQQGRIFNITSGVTVTLQYLTITNGKATNGGGIYNNDGSTLNVINSIISENTATNFSSGGGIYNCNNGTLIVTSSLIKGNTATQGDGGGISNNGGIYHNGGPVTITNCIIKDNKASGFGGGIHSDSGTLKVTRCIIKNNTAKNGGGIFNYQGTLKAHYNQIYSNIGYNIYCYSGSADAKYNWWGFNSSPSSKVHGTVSVTPWLVLKISASPTVIRNGTTSKITANLLYDSKGTYHNPTNGHILNGLSVTFKTTKGTINSTTSLKNGVATAILKGGATSGTAIVSVKLNNQTVTKSVTIDNTTPKVSSSSPTNGATKVTRNKTIKITFNESILAGSNYSKITLKASNGTTITIKKSISGKVLTITHAAKLKANTKYTLTLYKGSITDKAGNPLAAKTITFTTGKT